MFYANLRKVVILKADFHSKFTVVIATMQDMNQTESVNRKLNYR